MRNSLMKLLAARARSRAGRGSYLVAGKPEDAGGRDTSRSPRPAPGEGGPVDTNIVHPIVPARKAEVTRHGR